MTPIGFCYLPQSIEDESDPPLGVILRVLDVWIAQGKVPDQQPPSSVSKPSAKSEP